MKFLLWKTRVAFLWESQLRQSRATQSKMHAGRFSICIIHRTLTLSTEKIFNVPRDVNAADCARGCTDYRIFYVRTDVNACNCTWWCTDTARESLLKVDSGRKIPCRTGESNLYQRRAGAMLNQLNYIPTSLCADRRNLYDYSSNLMYHVLWWINGILQVTGCN